MSRNRSLATLALLGTLAATGLSAQTRILADPAQALLAIADQLLGDVRVG